MQRDMLRLKLGEGPSDELLDAFLMDAEAYIRGYTLMEDIPEALWSTQVQLAMTQYRRMGAEGEQSHEEGGVAIRFDDELASIRQQLAPWRKAFAGLQREADA